MKHIPTLTLLCISCLLTASAQTPPASSQPADKTTKHEQAGSTDNTTNANKTTTPPSGAPGTGNPSTTDTGKGGAAKTTPPAPTWVQVLAYSAMGLLLVSLIIASLFELRKWSLKDALSESIGGVYKASVSRLIAFLGFLVIISIYSGIGVGVVYQLLSGGPLSDLKGLGTFLAGAAALFAPYLANQIKGAVIGGNSGPSTTPPGSAASVASVIPNAISSGSPQTITATGANLDQIQSAICTLENGSELPIPATSLNVQNAGAVAINVTMPAPAKAGSTYQSTLTLITNTHQRIAAGSYSVS